MDRKWKTIFSQFKIVAPLKLKNRSKRDNELFKILNDLSMMMAELFEKADQDSVLASEIYKCPIVLF